MPRKSLLLLSVCQKKALLKTTQLKFSSYEFVVVISDGCVYALKRSLKPVAGSVDE